MRIGPHAATVPWSQCCQLWCQSAGRVKELVLPIAAHPLLQDLQMLHVFPHVGHRYLVRTEGALHLLSIDRTGTSPTLGCAQYNCRPARACREAVCPGLLLVGEDLGIAAIESGREVAMYLAWIVAVHHMHCVSIALDQPPSAFHAFAPQDGRTTNLVAIEVQDRQHRAVPSAIEKV